MLALMHSLDEKLIYGCFKVGRVGGMPLPMPMHLHSAHTHAVLLLLLLLPPPPPPHGFPPPASSPAQMPLTCPCWAGATWLPLSCRLAALKP